MRIIKIALTLLLIVAFSLDSYGETDFNKIYGLRDKGDLQRIITKVEARNPLDKKALKLLGIVYHNLAALEVRGASNKAVEYLEKVYKLSPQDYEILAYLGSAKTMLARDSWNVVIKVSKVNQGARMMDKAVKKAPDNLVVRMVRANNSLALPEFFKRRHLAKIDFLHIEELVKNSKLNLDIETKAEVFYQLGLIYKSEGNLSLAKEYFKKVIEIDQNLPWSIKAKKELR